MCQTPNIGDQNCSKMVKNLPTPAQVAYGYSIDAFFYQTWF